MLHADGSGVSHLYTSISQMCGIIRIYPQALEMWTWRIMTGGSRETKTRVAANKAAAVGTTGTRH